MQEPQPSGFRQVLAASLGALALTVAPPVSAALLTCPDSFIADTTAKVHDGSLARNTAAFACQYIDPPDQSVVANASNVNTAMFFGFADWMMTSVSQVSADAASGTWAITDPDFSAHDYMITFKSGQGTNLVSFLLNETFASGGWDTPFVASLFDLSGNAAARNVSHFSIFMRNAEASPEITLAEPTSLGLLGIAFIGIAAVFRRRRPR